MEKKNELAAYKALAILGYLLFAVFLVLEFVAVAPLPNDPSYLNSHGMWSTFALACFGIGSVFSYIGFVLPRSVTAEP